MAIRVARSPRGDGGGRGGGGGGSSDANDNESSSLGCQYRSHQLWVVVALVCCAVLFIQVASMAEEEATTVENGQVRTKVIEHNAGTGCLGVCRSRQETRQKKFSGDLLNRQDLRNMVQSAKDKLVEKLKVDYGEYFEEIFVGPGKSFSQFHSDGPSVDRLRRKLMIKVLEMQTHLMEQEKNVGDVCDCSEDGRALVKEVRLPELFLQAPDTYAKYVWATGGHSSAAGHGNLFNESYTAYLGRDARMVFEAIGINFEDRNYAMGGTSSAAEISMCWEQVFGSDVDFISWDYGMTDGAYTVRLMHFGYRAGLTPGRPAILGMKTGGRPQGGRHAALLELERLGMAVFYGSDQSFDARMAPIPDSAAGLTKAEIDALPEYVRNFRCGDQFERGDPFCGVEKYSKDICSPRGKQVAWHPGFKSHALDGHAAGLFIVDALIDAVNALATHEITDPVALLAELRKQEDELFETFRKSDIPDQTISALYNTGAPTNNDLTLNLKQLWTGPSLCRTARLPAQSRFLGITTNSSKVGAVAPLGKETYDVGYSIIGDVDGVGKSGVLPLAYDPGYKEREQCSAVILKPDHKDFFYARSDFGVSKLTIPNEMEREAYRYDPSQFKGLVLVVFANCDWGKCDQLDMRPEQYSERFYEFTVNGKVATELLPLGFDAWMLKGEDGWYWQSPSSNGSYEIGISVQRDRAYVRLSSIILY